MAGRSFPEEERAKLWRRCKCGESWPSIGRALGRRSCTLHGVVAAQRGIAPPVRLGAPAALTLPDREEILRGVAPG